MNNVPTEEFKLRGEWAGLRGASASDWRAFYSRPSAVAQPGPKPSVIFLSCLLSAFMPLALAFYWIAYRLAPSLTGGLLRVGLLAFACLLAFMWCRAPLTHAEATLLKVLGIAAVLFMVPALTATNPAAALAGWLKMMILFTICCCVARGLRHPPTAKVFGVSLLAGGLILTGFILYAYVLFQGFSLPTYQGARGFKGIAAANDVPLNTIAFAAVFSYLAGMCIVRVNKFLVVTAGPLFVTASIFTGSRAPLVILGISAFALVCINGLRSKSFSNRAVTFLVALAAVLAITVAIVLASNNALNHATEGRWHIWSVALQKFAERPLFGYGYESWGDDLVSRLPGEQDLTFALARGLAGGYHNEYLSVLAEEGLIGALAAGMIVWLLLRSSWLLTFRQGATRAAGQWTLFACIFLLFRANFEVPGLFGYAQEPVDYLAYIFIAIVISRFSIEEDFARASSL